jgi:PAS domain S-box-containing protein
MKVSVIHDHVKKSKKQIPESILKEKLVASEIRYRRLFESAKDGILILDAESGKIIDANPFLINLLGFSKDEFIEKEIWEIGLFRDIAANKDKFLELQQQEYVRYENLPLETAGGRKINVEFVSNVYLEKHRKIIQCNIRDITERKKRENALIDSENRRQTLLQTIPDLIWSKDTDGKYLSCNTMFERFFGASEADIVGKTDYDFIDRKLADFFRENDRKAMAAGKPTINEEWITFQDDGHHVYLETIKAPMYDARNELIGVLGIGRDITARINSEKALRQSEEKFRSYIDNAPDGVFVIDDTGRYIDVNEAACKMSGYSSCELLKMSIRDLLSEESVDEGLHQFRKLIQESASNANLLFRQKDGLKRWWSLDGVKLSEKRFLCFTKDITERKFAEKELILAKEKAEESDRLKSAFLSNMSHEIRTPMNGILGFTELLREPMLTGEQQQEYIDIISKSGARMLNIINDIMSISKIESGQMEIKMSDTDINELTEYVFNFFKPEAKQKNLQISFKNSLHNQKATIKTDREKVSTILINLVNNAIKFTSAGYIEFGYEKKANWLEFFVKDTGIGVTPELKELIFERFRQGSELLSRNYEGAGLGLSISKAYVEMLGGKIWVDTEPDNSKSAGIGQGKGSIFYFTIPYDPKKEVNITDKEVKVNNEIENQKKE